MKLRLIWLLYAVLVATTGTFLLYSATAEGWDGPASTALAVLAWGAQSVVWLVAALTSAALNAVTGGATGGAVQQLVCAWLTFFALATLQWLVIVLLCRLVQAVWHRLARSRQD